MKLRFFLLTIFLLSACSGNPAVANLSTAVPSLSPTNAPQLLPSLAPTREAISTPTLIPANPTPDFLSLPTRTPQPPAVCPQTDDKKRIQLGAVFKDKKAAWHDARQTILDFLNEGGDPKLALEKLGENSVTASQLDLTHDGVPEFILPSGYLTVFGCAGGQYQTLLELAPTDYNPIPLLIKDLNHNGVPEVLIGQAKPGNQASYFLLEWNGEKLETLLLAQSSSLVKSIVIENHTIQTVGTSNAQKGAIQGNWEIVDTDGNGLPDITIRAGVSASSSLEESLTLKWDGKNYVIGSSGREATPTATATNTPLPFSATCANTNPALKYQPANDGFSSLSLGVGAFLNAGGTVDELNRHFKAISRDLNQDGAPEVFVIGQQNFFINIFMFSCVTGKYIEIESLARDDIAATHANVIAVKDNNQNGYPELFIREIGCINDRCGALYVVEWDGKQFTQRIRDFQFSQNDDYADMFAPVDSYLKDLDSDGMDELVWAGEILPESVPDYWIDYPQRLATHVYKWDGQNYTAQVVEYTPPRYRFEAIQDGDRYANGGLYEKALKSYGLAIQSDDLDWWSQARKDYIIGPHGLGPCANAKPVCQPPTPIADERPILSAYASFRSLVVHLLMGNPIEAEQDYQNLLSTYSATNAGYAVTQMASAFWQEYQASKSLGTACGKAVEYAKTKSDMLLIISGSNTGQGFDYQYRPEYVCPFK